MTDTVSPATRSRMMSGIRGRNTGPERLVRSLLHRHGFRFRLHAAHLPGHPDLVLPRYRAVVFVHGCFWHGHECALFRWPGTREAFWRAKITGNRHKDERTRAALLENGWRVAVVWECALRGRGTNPDAVARRLGRWLQGTEACIEEGR